LNIEYRSVVHIKFLIVSQKWDATHYWVNFDSLTKQVCPACRC